jgi:hypothetical protein
MPASAITLGGEGARSMGSISKDGDRRRSGDPYRIDPDLERLASDPSTWGEPPSLVELLNDPTVQNRVVRVIMQATLKSPRYRR